MLDGILEYLRTQIVTSLDSNSNAISFANELIKKVQEGKSIILISEELAELIGMADKILIMKDFKVTHEFMRDPGLSETDIIEYMI